MKNKRPVDSEIEARSQACRVVGVEGIPVQNVKRLLEARLIEC